MIAWGSQVPITYALLARWDPLTLSVLRYALAVPVILLVLWLREGWRAPPRALWQPLALLGGIGMAGPNILYTMGLAHADPVTAIVIQSASPVTATLIAWLVFRVRPERGLGLALGLAVAGGVLARLWGSAGIVRSGAQGGELLLVMSSACWAWYSLGCQRWLPGQSQLWITAGTVAPATASVGFVYLIARASGIAQAPDPVPALDALALAWMAISSTCMGVLFWNAGVSRLGLPVSALYLNLIPVVAILVAAASGVVPRWPQIAGGLLVLAGVAQAQLRRRAG
jgi:drug/metabolite transporter (DMT)-like permease